MEIIDGHMHLWSSATHPWLSGVRDGGHPAGKFGQSLSVCSASSSGMYWPHPSSSCRVHNDLPCGGVPSRHCRLQCDCKCTCGSMLVWGSRQRNKVSLGVKNKKKKDTQMSKYILEWPSLMSYLVLTVLILASVAMNDDILCRAMVDITTQMQYRKMLHPLWLILKLLPHTRISVIIYVSTCYC